MLSYFLVNGVTPSRMSQSLGENPAREVKALSKIGHRWTPKGRSNVGTPTSHMADVSRNEEYQEK